MIKLYPQEQVHQRGNNPTGKVVFIKINFIGANYGQERKSRNGNLPEIGSLNKYNELMEINANDPRGRGKRDICFQPFQGFTITPEGYMSACVLDYSKDLIVADLN